MTRSSVLSLIDRRRFPRKAPTFHIQIVGSSINKSDKGTGSPRRDGKEDGYGQQKQLAVLSDLVASENSDARSVRDLVRNKKFDKAIESASESASPFGKINELFRIAGSEDYAHTL